MKTSIIVIVIIGVLIIGYFVVKNMKSVPATNQETSTQTNLSTTSKIDSNDNLDPALEDLNSISNQ